jgi:hypothetical protein
VTGEPAILAAEAVPLAAIATSTYGRAVLAKAWDDVADASLKAGLKLLQRVFGHRKDDEGLPAAVAEVIDHPGDEDYLALLKLEIRKAIERDAALAREIAAIVADAGPTGNVTQHVVSGHDSNVFGRDGYIAGRDIKITRPPGPACSSGTPPGDRLRHPGSSWPGRSGRT